MKKPSPDLSLAVLKDIRKEIRTTNERVDKLSDSIDAMDRRLVTEVGSVRQEVTHLREELSRRIVESEIRTSTAIADLAGTVREMTAVLRASTELKPRVEWCEHEIEALKRRVPA